jgi:hypothetical protein
MSYTVHAVIDKKSLKPKIFNSKESALRFMAKVLDSYNLQVNKIIEKNVVGAEEYVCEGERSRILISKTY